MPADYTCACGLYVHPSKRNPRAIHIKDCPYAETKMTEEQKQVCRELLRLSHENGYAGLYPLKPIAAMMGKTVKELYDPETDTGILFEFAARSRGKHGGFLTFSLSGTHAGISVDTRSMLENMCKS